MILADVKHRRDQQTRNELVEVTAEGPGPGLGPGPGPGPGPGERDKKTQGNMMLMLR